MPLYEYLCENGHKFDRYLKLANYKDEQTCDCGASTRKLISTPMIAPMFEDYESPIDGRPITSKQKRLDDMARNDCVPYEVGIVEENTKKLKTAEDKLERDIDRTVDYSIAQMPTKQREKLEQELKHTNIEFVRK